MFGMTFDASSDISNRSTVAMNAIRPATRAWTKGSLRAREKAGTSTLRLVLYPRDGAKRPMRMHVFVRIEASESVCVLANKRSRSLLRIRSVSFVCT